MDNKILVTYFSASGVTAGVAKELAYKINADIFEIEPEIPYTSADLNWMDKKSRSTLEMTDLSSRPKIAKQVENMGKYQIIFIGFPVWWYVEPRIIDTFLESYDFKGKTLIPFATSGGSSIDKSAESMEAHCPSAIWKQGRLLNHGVDMKWIQKLLK